MLVLLLVLHLPSHNNTNLGTPVLSYPIGFPYIAATDIVVFTGETGNWTLRNQGTGANEYAVNPQNGLGTDQCCLYWRYTWLTS